MEKIQEVREQLIVKAACICAECAFSSILNVVSKAIPSFDKDAMLKDLKETYAKSLNQTIEEFVK